jgi:outer membrane biosynthesis protein TonB
MFVILLMIITLSSSIGGGIRYRENFLQEILELNDISNDALNDLQFDYNSFKKIEEEETITKPPPFVAVPPPPPSVAVPPPPPSVAVPPPPPSVVPSPTPSSVVPSPTPSAVQAPPRIRSPTDIPKPSSVQAIAKSTPYIIEGYQGESYASF